MNTCSTWLARSLAPRDAEFLECASGSGSKCRPAMARACPIALGHACTPRPQPAGRPQRTAAASPATRDRQIMRLLKPTLTSIYGLLGHTGPTPERSADLRMENIRKVMLDAMSVDGVTEGHHLLVRRVFYATDIQTLWYARSEVMTLLAAGLGETRAHEKLCALSALFDGLLPEARHSAPSRAARAPRRR